MPVGMRCVKLEENTLVFSEKDQIIHIICLSKPCARISRLLSLIDGVTTLLTALSILTEKEEHSFLNIDLLINPNVSC